MKKYELTDESIEYCGRTLRRIKALKSFRYISKGELGGFIEKESNLSQDGYCWVCNNAKVFDNAQVRHDSIVFDDAIVFNNVAIRGGAIIGENSRIGKSSDYLTVGPIGRRHDIVTFFRTSKGISVCCGCFRDTIDEFEKRVEEVHKGTKHEKTYKLAIELAKAQIEIRKEK